MRIFLVRLPGGGIGFDVAGDAVEVIGVADHVFEIIPLPNG